MTSAGSDGTIKLSDGRTLSYAEYGDPAGTPLFYFHGFPSCHVEARIAGPAAERLGVRVIALDRPGFGRSDFKKGRTIGDWPDDVAEAADHLRIERFAVLGESGGGPYAAACARKIPQRLTRAAIVSGWGPVDKAEARAGLPWLSRFTLALWRRVPLFAYLTMWYLALVARWVPRLAVRMAWRGLPRPDRQIVEKPAMRSMMVDVLRDTFRRGSRGHAHETLLFARPWDFTLEDIATEVHLWHGDADETVPVSMGRYVAQTIPNCRATFVPGAGHFWIFEHFDEVLAKLIP
jgi:pimeloyl-ACP methyl ester carboxylesterase